jgi:hypothetical protein
MRRLDEAFIKFEQTFKHESEIFNLLTKFAHEWKKLNPTSPLDPRMTVPKWKREEMAQEFMTKTLNRLDQIRETSRP